MFSLPVNRQRHIGGLSFFSPRRQEGEAPEYFAIVPEFPAKKHLKKLLPFVISIFCSILYHTLRVNQPEIKFLPDHAKGRNNTIS